MDVYQGSLSQKSTIGDLSHFGSLLAACQRIESLFCAQALRLFNGQNFGVFKHNGAPVKIASPDEIYNDFLAFIESARVRLYHPNFKKGLSLCDCWDDDPIGSGGLSIFNEQSAIPPQYMKELEALFHPFGREILDMDVIHRKLSPDTIKSWEKTGRTNTIFKAELEKRKHRSELRGEDWQEVKPYEIVWTHYTIKLRAWALSKGYDFFQYKNDGEDEGSKSYIALAPKSVGIPVETYSFDTRKLKDIAAPLFMGALQDQRNKSQALKGSYGGRILHDVYWCGLAPTSFLIPQPS